MSKLAIPYIRMSTTEQLKGHSLQRQTDDINEYALENNMSVDWTTNYIDIGKSAFKGKHLTKEAGLGRLLGAAQAGAIPEGTALLIESLDRLSRLEVKRALSLVLAILDYGIEIHTIGLAEKSIYTNETKEGDLIIAIILLSRANNESKMKQERLQKSWENKRKIAIEQKKPITKVIPAWLYVENEKFEVHEDRAKTVKRIFEYKINGIGKEKTSKIFNEENIDTWGVGKKKAEYWRGSYIDRIIANKAVLGIYTANKYREGEKILVQEIEDYYPKIIDESTFYQANSKKKINAGRKSPYLSNLFTGLVVCKKCGSKMHMGNKGGTTTKGGKYLVCSLAKSGKGCEYKTFRYEWLEDNVLSYLRELDLDFIVNNRNDDENLKDKKDTEVLLHKEHEKLENINKEIIIMTEKGLKVPSILYVQSGQAEEEIEKYRRQIQDINETLTIKILSFKEMKDYISNIKGENYEIRARANSVLTDILDKIEIEIFQEGRRKAVCTKLTFKNKSKEIELILNADFWNRRSDRIIISSQELDKFPQEIIETIKEERTRMINKALLHTKEYRRLYKNEGFEKN